MLIQNSFVNNKGWNQVPERCVYFTKWIFDVQKLFQQQLLLLPQSKSLSSWLHQHHRTHSNTTYSFVPEYISTATCNNVSGQISTADSTNITEYIATADITYNITGCIFTSTTVCTQSTIRVKTKQLQQSSSTQEPSMLQYSGKHIISTA